MTIRFIMLIFVLLAIWSIIIEPRWVVHRVIDTKLPNQKLLGLKVIHTSDWHFTKNAFWRVMNHQRARSIIKDINKKPKLTLY